MFKTKYILILSISLLASIILGSCGTQAAPEPATTQTPANQPAPVSSPQEAPTKTAESIPTDVLTEAPTEPPTEAPAEDPAGEISFANDVFPILDSRCITCHGGDRIEGELVMLSFDELMAGSENGLVIIPGDPENSTLVDLVSSQKMPKRGPKLTPPQVQLITDWVTVGAPNN